MYCKRCAGGKWQLFPLLMYHCGTENYYHSTIVLQLFFRDHPGKPVPEENFWTLWYKGRLTEADTPTIRLGATSSGLPSAHLHHPPFFTYRMPFLPPNQQCQSSYLLFLTLYSIGRKPMRGESVNLGSAGKLRWKQRWHCCWWWWWWRVYTGRLHISRRLHVVLWYHWQIDLNLAILAYKCLHKLVLLCRGWT